MPGSRLNPKYGVYAAPITFFNEDASLDLPSTLAHVQRMAVAGIAGLVIQDSNADLNHSECMALVQAIRAHCNEIGHQDVQLIVGCGTTSVQSTLDHIAEARDSGADFALVLPPTPWIAAMNVPLLEGFFCDIAAKSSLPLLIYNFPGVSSSIDVSSDAIIRVPYSVPSINGLKSSCTSTGRLTRISATLWPLSSAALGGKSDFFDTSLFGIQGVISMLANIAPKVHVRLLSLYRAGDLQGAKALQAKLAHANSALTKVGAAGVKAVIAHYFGYGSARACRPLAYTTMGLGDEVLEIFAELTRLEHSM
ncbi:dihydrodipicolinate synthase family protein [Aspergillus puulaauensis]|uniref:Dihydrodipicolinate synthase n=1 Tax=Aspergillus puulaauensis TaxID=1220207 RepID=A0A7R7XSZ5_9EURO|nr:uncharacterized protein APUU_60054S [Aspergillus puulaauensis]BCS27006.1 hypothetical protein APUU_60054S [Aspergillus puulaauensis]